jgi:hypothetical protein
VTTLEAFQKRVSKDSNSDCWNWTGATKNGYGRMPLGKRGTWTYAHIFSYEKFKGPHQKGMHLDHLCRNTLCVNSAHLELVTPRVNILRGVGPSAKHAAQTHCAHGHEFTVENTYLGKKGNRVCKACRLQNSRDFYAENKEYYQKRYQESKAI